MKKHAFCIIVFVCMSMLASVLQATTVMIEPVIQDSPEVGEAVTVNVKVADVTGLFGYSFGLAFDNTALKFSDVKVGEFLGSDGTGTLNFLDLGDQQVYFDLPPDISALLLLSGQKVSITPDIAAEVSSAGVLTVASSRLGDAANIDGTGVLLKVTFEVLEVKDSKLELQDVELGTSLPDSEVELIPAEVENGAVVAPAFLKGDVNEDGEVGSDDAVLTLRIAVNLITPTDYQKSAADMNDDGEIKANDAITILRIVVGLAAPGTGIAISANRQTVVTLAEAHGVAGESIIVPLEVSNTYGVAGGDFSIQYDPEVLRAVDVSSHEGVLLASNFSEPGMLRIAFAGADGLSNRTLARIRFDILTDDTSPLKFRAVELYNPDAVPIDSRGIDREFASWAIPPERSDLLQNFPNPLNPETWIPYQLKDAGEVTIRIYNAVGELVRELDLGYKTAGLYVSPDRAARWDGKNRFGVPVASGVYFYSIRTGDFVAVRKLIVLK